MADVARPQSPVNVAVHIIVHALQNAPGFELSKPALKALVRQHVTGCSKTMFEDACDKVTLFGYAERIPTRESGLAVSQMRLTVSGKRAKVWIPS